MSINYVKRRFEPHACTDESFAGEAGFERDKNTINPLVKSWTSRKGIPILIASIGRGRGSLKEITKADINMSAVNGKTPRWFAQKSLRPSRSNPDEASLNGITAIMNVSRSDSNSSFPRKRRWVLLRITKTTNAQPR